MLISSRIPIRPPTKRKQANRDREGFTASPSHTTGHTGPRIRRFGRCGQGEYVTPTGASSPGVPAGGSPRQPDMIRHLAGCHLHRSTTGHDSLSTVQAFNTRARVYYAICSSAAERSGRMAPPASPLPGHPADLPRSAVIPSVPRRPIDQAQSHCGWRALLSRARSPRLYHTSDWVRYPCPAPAFHAVLQTPPHGDALALPWSFGSTHTWTGDFHPHT